MRRQFFGALVILAALWPSPARAQTFIGPVIAPFGGLDSTQHVHGGLELQWFTRGGERFHLDALGSVGSTGVARIEFGPGVTWGLKLSVPRFLANVHVVVEPDLGGNHRSKVGAGGAVHLFYVLRLYADLLRGGGRWSLGAGVSFLLPINVD